MIVAAEGSFLLCLFCDRSTRIHHSCGWETWAAIRSSLDDAIAAAAAPTSGVAPAAADEVSAAIARLFGTYGQNFQALNTQAAAFNQQFVGLLNGGGAAYFSTEMANAQQNLMNAINAPALTLSGQMWTGGANASAAMSAASDGGLLGGYSTRFWAAPGAVAPEAVEPPPASRSSAV